MDPNRLTNIPSYIHRNRVRQGARERAAEEMAGRTVWCLSEEAGRRMPTPGTLWELIGRFEPDDRLPGSGVGPDDIIVLDDVRARPAAAAAREEGGHVVWLTAVARGDVEAGRVWDLVRRRAGPADAFLLSERQRRGRRDVERVALMMPVARTVAVAEIDVSHRSAWLPLLAGIVHDDRHEMVAARGTPAPWSRRAERDRRSTCPGSSWA